ncbi:MAG: hypothetical protein GY820_41025 [Gammaproteobacteria bacterium]|nr:hypothetical protein [Gammaproteobacteria bacterium]
MSGREPIVWVEIDVDQCTLEYGVGSCPAVLGTDSAAKCFNTYKTCPVKDSFDLGSLTYKFYMPQQNLPKEAGVFPCLKTVSASSGEVNIAGTNPNVKGLGKRERITFTCSDFAYGDGYTDKYAQERRTGAAQASSIGYDPETRGTFFGKLRARWPYYSGRACRVNEAYFDNGVLTDVVTRHYVLTGMTVDVSGNQASFEAKDILTLADDKSATCPIANTGELVADITDTDTEFTLTPTGIGNSEYEASGRIIIGSEIMSFTRSGDVMTITGRGLSNTDVSSHSSGDSVQQTFRVDSERIDDVVKALLEDYAGIDPAFIPFTDWQAEVTRWAASLKLTAEITKPTGVNSLLSEIAPIGVSIWWNRQTQEIGLKINRPPDEDTVFDFNDQANIKSIDVDDRDDKRLTQIGIYSDIMSPTISATEGDSYNRLRQIVDIDAQSDNEFGDTRIRQIYIRWLGAGNDSTIRIIGKRLINRFRWSPSFYKFTVTYDPDLELTDVIRVNSRVHQDETGANLDKLMQAVSIKYDKPKHEMTVTAQVYQFDQKYALIAPNATPVYTISSDAERGRYAFFADDTTEKMSDGSEPYVFI